MADKDFKVKNKLFVNGLSNASGVILATNNNLDSSTTLPTQYGGTGTTTSPNAGQIPYSSSGTNYAPTDLSSLTISSSGGSTITAASASTKGLIIKGAASQTANLQEWQNSSGTVLAKVDANGKLDITPSSGDTINFRNSSGGLTLWGGNSSYFMNTGLYMTGGSWAAGRLGVDTQGAANIGLVIRGAASQTANLQEWQNSSGTALSYITKDGTLDLRNTSATAFAFTNSGTVGPKIDLWGGQYGIGIVSGRMSFFTPASGGIALKQDSYSGTSVFDVAYNGATLIGLQSASAIGLVIKAAASQTANLQEWQNSSGTVLTRVNNNGNIIVGNSYISYTDVSAYGRLQIQDIGTNQTTLYPMSAGFLIQNLGVTGMTILKIRGAPGQTANLQEWQNSAGTVLASISAAGNLTVQDLTVNGTTTTINSTTLTVDDKNIELASVASPTDTTADGAGITIKGATDKTFNWVQSTGAFTSSEPISTPALSVSGNSVSSNITLAAGKRYFVDTTSARTLTLPASPSLGDEIKIFDASGTAATNNITVARNGNKINGITDDAIIDVNQSSSVFVYTGATVGWRFD